MRETAVRLLGLLLVLQALAMTVQTYFETIGMTVPSEGIELSGPGLVELFQQITTSPLSFWSSIFPYTLAVGLVFCFAARPISRWITPARQQG